MTSGHSMQRKALLIGGSGFLGKHLTESLSTGCAEVEIADTKPPDFSLPENCTFRHADVRMPLPSALESPDLLVNLAAVHRTPGHPEADYYETNVLGARNVLNFCRERKVRSLWFTSSIAVYGPSEERLTEESEPRPTSAYGISKLIAEDLHRAWANEAHGRRVVIARPGTIFGPGENGNFSLLAKALRTRAFVYPGRRDARKACAYVGDMHSAFAYMEDRCETEVTFNYCFPVAPTLEDVCNAMAAIPGYRRPVATVPRDAVFAFGRALSPFMRTVKPARIGKLITSTNIGGQKLSDEGFEFAYSLRSGMRAWCEEAPTGKLA